MLYPMIYRESVKTIRRNVRALLTNMLKYKYEPDHKDKALYKDIAWRAYMNIADEFDNYDKESPYRYYTKHLNIERLYAEAIVEIELETGLDSDSFPTKCEWNRLDLINPRKLRDFFLCSPYTLDI